MHNCRSTGSDVRAVGHDLPVTLKRLSKWYAGSETGLMLLEMKKTGVLSQPYTFHQRMHSDYQCSA
jgi:hypothetical protein